MPLFFAYLQWHNLKYLDMMFHSHFLFLVGDACLSLSIISASNQESWRIIEGPSCRDEEPYVFGPVYVILKD